MPQVSSYSAKLYITGLEPRSSAEQPGALVNCTTSALDMTLKHQSRALTAESVRGGYACGGHGPWMLAFAVAFHAAYGKPALRPPRFRAHCRDHQPTQRLKI